jgi:hypothetical protein
MVTSSQLALLFRRVACPQGPARECGRNPDARKAKKAEAELECVPREISEQSAHGGRHDVQSCAVSSCMGVQSPWDITCNEVGARNTTRRPKVTMGDGARARAIIFPPWHMAEQGPLIARWRNGGSRMQRAYMNMRGRISVSSRYDDAAIAPARRLWSFSTRDGGWVLISEQRTTTLLWHMLSTSRLNLTCTS